MSEAEYCNVCENFPCLGNHPPGLMEALRDEQAEGYIRDGLVTWPAGSPRPIYFSPFRGSLVIREAFAMEKERERREWIEGIRRRLGLVSEVHRCRVWRCSCKRWGWSCRRPGCAEWHSCKFRSPISAAHPAFAHARSFIPQPLPEEPMTELDFAVYAACNEDAARRLTGL